MRKLIKTGSLTNQQIRSKNNFKPNNVCQIIDIRNNLSYDLVDVRRAYRGVCIRDGSLQTVKFYATAIKEDPIHIQSGGSKIESMYINHDAVFTYEIKDNNGKIIESNHSDVLQAYSYNFIDDQIGIDNSIDFNGLYVGHASIKVTQPKRNGFMLSETCLYKNINLFEYGLSYDVPNSVDPRNKNPFFLQATNLTAGSSIGSPAYPLDPSQLSKKGIEIGTNKSDAPLRINDVTIHMYHGVKISYKKPGIDNLGVNVIRYKRKWNAEERIDKYQQLITSQNLVSDK